MAYGEKQAVEGQKSNINNPFVRSQHSSCLFVSMRISNFIKKDKMRFIFSIMMWAIGFASCAQQPSKKATNMNTKVNYSGIVTDTATFGEGCFWCTEAFFQRLEGVLEVVSGYGGGFVENPTYEQVCDKNT